MPMIKKKIIIGIMALLIAILVVNFAFASSKTITVKETELVKIGANITDPDQDSINLRYSLPLNNEGEWLTNYGDAGEYNIEITASDGKKETTETIKLIVEHKNRPPFLSEEKIIIKENQLIDLKSIVSDPDNDKLKFSFQPPFDEEGLWQTGYYDQGSYNIKFSIDDGKSMINAEVELNILNTNQPPIVNNTFSPEDTYYTTEDKTVNFYAYADDQENNQLSYEWRLDDKIIGNAEEVEFHFNFESAGEHSLNLTVSDEESYTQRSWYIEVKNINREPEINHPPLIINEWETLELDLPEYDLDQDKITYTFSTPLDYQGSWQTGFDDAGEYTAKIIASDGEINSEAEVKITVLDVDREPDLEVPDILEVWEGGKLEWEIKAFDPDGDKISFSLTNAPFGSIFNHSNNLFAWEPGYEAIYRKSSFFSNVLNSLRLEKYFLEKKEMTMLVNACGKDLCSSKEAKITLFNSNRAPNIEPIGNITIKEGEELKLVINATDPDGDFIKYYFQSPLARNGEWKPMHNNAGEYISSVKASDGLLESSLSINIKVIKDNRAPTIKLDADNIKVNEGQEINLEVKVKDMDNDNITISLNNLPSGASLNGNVFSWTPDYTEVTNKTNNWWNNFIGKYPSLNKKFNDEETVHWLEFSAFDGEIETIHPMKVTVKNFNLAPMIIDYLPVNEQAYFVNEPVLFHIAAKDSDGDPLQFKWDFGIEQKKIETSNTIERKFTSPGIKKVKVTISDGRLSIEKEWEVTIVEKINKEVALEPEKLDIKVYVIDTP